MEDLHRQVCLFANPQSLLDGGDFTLAFTSHVTGVNASVLPGNFREFDQFLGLGIVAGRIDQRGRDAERTLLHSLADQSLHLFEFFRSRRTIGIAHHRFSYLRGADVSPDVDGRPGFFETRKIL